MKVQKSFMDFIAKAKNLNKNGAKTGKGGFNIKLQLAIGFIIPVIFIVIVGIVSYSKASSGLVTNYEDSALNAVEMTLTCLEQEFTTLKAMAMELAGDSTVKAYGIGGYADSEIQHETAQKNIKSDITVKQGLNKAVENIYIIPIQSEKVLTTKTMNSTSELDSFINGMIEAGEDSGLQDERVHWGSEHPYLDQQVENTGDEYVMYCSRRFGSGDRLGIVYIDIENEYIMNLLAGLDFGEESQITFTTAEGKTLNVGNQKVDVTTLKEYDDTINSEETMLSGYTNIDGKNHFYMMAKSKETGAIVSVLVPRSYITQQSDDIRLITVLMVVLATFTAVGLATLIIRNMSVNIQKGINNLGEVAKGNLVLKQEKIPNNEFGHLRAAIRDTANRIRGLVVSVSEMIGGVSQSSEQVTDSSIRMEQMVSGMNEDIRQIAQNMEQESNHIEECNRQMEELSETIKSANANIAKTVRDVEETKGAIENGMKAMDSMNEQAEQTATITGEACGQVLELNSQLSRIVEFVENIEEIAEQTNLLSLNASIEAARAGEAGRGFSVVAEEIRKLATDSAATALSIKETIGLVNEKAEGAVEKVQHTQDIVAMQNEQVRDTVAVFERISAFVQNLIDNMEMLAKEMEYVNNERKQSLTTMRDVNEISYKNKNFLSAMQVSMEQQMEFAGKLSQEAEFLKKNMKELEEGISTFRLE